MGAFVSKFSALFASHPIIVVLGLGIISFFVWYTIHYYTRAVSKVSVHYHMKNRWASEIVKRSRRLRGRYWPAFLVFNSHLQGILTMKLRPVVDPKYERETLIAEDGASLELDWSPQDASPEDAPILVMYSGITGNSSSSYMTYLSKEAQRRGWKTVAMNYPNAHTNCPMTAPRFFAKDPSTDVEQVVNHVHQRYPSAPLIGVGFSIGAHFLMMYLERMGFNTPLTSVVIASSPWSPGMCNTLWKSRPVNMKVYDQHFLQKFQSGVKNNRKVFEGVIDPDQVLNAKNMDEFHMALSVPLFGYTTVDEYYSHNDSGGKNVLKIAIPVLALHAWNDPVVPPPAVPKKYLVKNPNVVFASTRSGGHTGWMSGFLFGLMQLTWGEKVILEFVSNCLDISKEVGPPPHLQQREQEQISN